MKFASGSSRNFSPLPTQPLDLFPFDCSTRSQSLFDVNHTSFRMPSQRQKILTPLNSDEEVTRVFVEMSSEYSTQRQASFEAYMSELCNDPSGQGGVYLVKLLRTHSLSFENIVDLRKRFVPSFSNMEWKHARQLWPQYKYHTSIPEFTPIEPYIPKSFATEVFRAIEEAEVDTCPLNAAADEAKVVAWMQAVYSCQDQQPFQRYYH